MIKPEIILEVQRLLAAGHCSRRRIARRVGVARGTVSTVADGKRLAVGKLRRRSPAARLPQQRLQSPPDAGGTVADRRKARRRAKPGKRSRRPLQFPQGPIGLNLKPQHQARYAQVRRWRRRIQRLGLLLPVDPD